MLTWSQLSFIDVLPQNYQLFVRRKFCIHFRIAPDFRIVVQQLLASRFFQNRFLLFFSFFNLFSSTLLLTLKLLFPFSFFALRFPFIYISLFRLVSLMMALISQYLLYRHFHIFIIIFSWMTFPAFISIFFPL